jgi:hypothetical protein
MLKYIRYLLWERFSFLLGIGLSISLLLFGIYMNIKNGDSIIENLVLRNIPAYKEINYNKLKEPIIVSADPNPDNLKSYIFLRRLFKQITRDVDEKNDQEKAIRVAAWVQLHFVHPEHTPLRPDGSTVHDPIQLIKTKRVQCGQVNRVLLDILEAGGYQGRIVQLKAHQGAEVFFNGSWHYIEGDALTNGEQIRKPDGSLPSAEEIYLNPSLLKGICLSCEFELFNNAQGSFINEAVKLAFTEDRDYYHNGNAWEAVFSIKPEYYQKNKPSYFYNDPEYGWMNYTHTNAQGQKIRFGL